MSPRTVSPVLNTRRAASAGCRAGQLLVELAAAELGHPEVGDHQVELLAPGQLEALAAVARHHRDVAPRLECGVHVVQNVRLVIDHQHPKAFRRGSGAGVGGRRGRPGRERKLHREGRAPAFLAWRA